MRLLIAAVLTSLVIPVFWGAYDELSENITESSLEKAAYRLLSAVSDVMSGGTGSALEVDIKVEGFGSAEANGLFVGGDVEGNGSERYIISFCISGGPKRCLSLRQPVAMASPDGKGLALGDGHHRLKVVHKEREVLHYAEISPL
jgi:hypothetical protein